MSFKNAFLDEIKLYFYDKWLLSSVSIVLLVVFFLSTFIFGSGSVRELPIGLIDNDKSFLSRDMSRYINSSSFIDIVHIYPNENIASAAMRASTIYGYVVIPKDFERDIKRGLSPTLGAYTNTQFMLVGRSIETNLMQVVEYFNARISVYKSLLKGNKKIDQSIDEVVPFRQQMSPLYNMGVSYSLFLLSAILPAFWQIALVATLILSFAAQRRKTGIFNWIDQGAFKMFGAKLLVHQIIMLFWFTCIVIYFYIYLKWQFNGSFTYLFLAGYLTILASQAMGCLFYFTNYDAAKSLSSAAAYTAPSMAFAGITFPVSDMSPFAKIWSELIPISHYLKIQIAQANYASLNAVIIKEYGYLLCFLSAFFVVALSIRMLKGRIQI